MIGEKLKRQRVISLARGWAGPMRAAAVAPARQKIDVEALLRWAYVQELPKIPRAPDAPDGFRDAWDKVSEMGRELSLAGLDNSFGVVPDFFARELPHPDALLVHDAVCALDGLEVEGLADFSPFDATGDAAMQKLLDQCAARARRQLVTIDDDGQPRLRKTLRQMVFASVILGMPPDWEIGEFARDFERWECGGAVKYFKRSGHWENGAFGEVWVEFETPVTGRAGHRVAPDEYPREILTPDPCDDGVSRMQHELWRLALDVVEADLIGRLEKWDVTPCLRPHRPWLEGQARRGRVLPDLAQRAANRVALRGAQKKMARTA